MRAYIFGSGSKGNSTLLVSNNTKILIDIGFNYKKMKLNLENIGYTPSDIDGVLITHTHKDHVGGLKLFIKDNPNIKVYANNVLYKELLKIIDEDSIIEVDSKFNIKDINIESFKTSHDAKGSVGFIINDNKTDLVYVTDTGFINKDNLSKLINKNVYIFESNHDIEMLMNGPYPYILKQRVLSDEGHLSNNLASEYLEEIVGCNTKKVILAHLSETNNTHEIAYNTVYQNTNKIKENNIELLVASQDDMLDIGEI